MEIPKDVLEKLRKTDPDYSNVENQEEYDVAYTGVIKEYTEEDFNNLDIDWKRVAEPQKDNYDIQAIKKVREFLFNKKNINFDGKAEFFKGTVSIPNKTPANHAFTRYLTKKQVLGKKYTKVIRQAEDIFYKLLPDYVPTIENLVDYYQPFLMLDSENKPFLNFGLGCSCGVQKTSWDDEVVLTSSLNTAIGSVDGLIHESFHDRLRSLGISLVRHTGDLIDNPPGMLYESPIRKDIKRPIAAVVQAQYSYIGVNDFYHRILLNLEMFPQTNEYEVSHYLKDLVNKIKGGLETINAHLIPKKGAGEEFFSGFMSYSERIIKEVEVSLEKCNLK